MAMPFLADCSAKHTYIAATLFVPNMVDYGIIVTHLNFDKYGLSYLVPKIVDYNGGQVIIS